MFAFSGFSWVRLGVITSPALLNSRSERRTRCLYTKILPLKFSLRARVERLHAGYASFARSGKSWQWSRHHASGSVSTPVSLIRSRELVKRWWSISCAAFRLGVWAQALFLFAVLGLSFPRNAARVRVRCFFAGGGVTTGVSDATGVDGGTPGSSASSAIISFVNALLHLANFLFWKTISL